MLSFFLRSFLLHTFCIKAQFIIRKEESKVLARRASYDKKTLARQVIPLAPGYRTALSSHPALHNVHACIYMSQSLRSLRRIQSLLKNHSLRNRHFQRPKKGKQNWEGVQKKPYTKETKLGGSAKKTLHKGDKTGRECEI